MIWGWLFVVLCGLLLLVAYCCVAVLLRCVRCASSFTDRCLLIVDYGLLLRCCLPFAVCCLSVAWRWECVVRCSLFAVYCWLLCSCCVLFAVCCLLFVVRLVLFVACCL